ncbi:MAG: histidine phosphatase family protein [Paludibacter sp.]
MRIIDEIKKHPDKSKLALLIRHGDREQIPQGEFGNEILLNEKGRKNSLAFGVALKEFPVKRIFTSPIPRCAQTAELIAEGYGNNLEIISTKCLGDPGLHTADEKIAGEYYLAHGLHEILKMFMRNDPVPGVSNVQHLKSIMTKFLHESTNENGLTVFVTHDSLIAMYHYCLNKTVYTEDNWVNYLDGLVYKFEDEQ